MVFPIVYSRGRYPSRIIKDIINNSNLNGLLSISKSHPLEACRLQKPQRLLQTEENNEIQGGGNRWNQRDQVPDHIPGRLHQTGW